MRVALIFLMLCTLSVNAQPEEALQAEQGICYQGLEPGVFMKQWLTCGPFPLFEAEGKPGGEIDQRQAFNRDFLIEHGGGSEHQARVGDDSSQRRRRVPMARLAKPVNADQSHGNL
ncbi:MAG: hypothetical protein K9N55_16530 [Phycisphaerae bacterium]|nr:hypothetical protein [Phycisphaerae bacterium]